VYFKDLDEKLINHDPPLMMDASSVLDTVTLPALLIVSKFLLAAGLEDKSEKIWVKTWKRTNLNVTKPPIEAKSLAGFQNFETKSGDHLYKHMTKFPDSTPYITNLAFNIAYGHESKIILQAPDEFII
ncbi:4448_t:CDS:2, partial [Racocetra persica]